MFSYLNILCIIILIFITIYYTKSKNYRTGQLALILISIIQGVFISLTLYSGNFGFIYSVLYSVIYYIIFYYGWLFRNLFFKKNIVDYDNENLKNLIKKYAGKLSCKIQLKKLLGKNSFNAFFKKSASKYQIVIGEELIEKLYQKELIPIFAHELSHIQKKHVLKKMLFAIPLIILVSLSIEINRLIIINYLQTSNLLIYALYWFSITIFFILCILNINIFSWWIENEADKYAIIMTKDFKTFKSAFNKIDNELKYKDYGRFFNLLIHDHPIIKSRIQKVEKIAKEFKN
jgi:STE24 endopeptidase